MKSIKKILISISLIVCVSGVKAHFADTIPVNQFFDFTVSSDDQIREKFKSGYRMVLNDSIDHGMRLIGESLDHLSKTSEKFRKQNYPAFEAFSLVRDFGLYELNENEKRFRDQCIEHIKQKDEDAIKKLTLKSIKKNRKSELFARIDLMINYFENDENVNIEKVEEVLKLAPNHAPANLLMGLILQDKEAYTESIKYFTNAINTAPTNAYLYCKRGDSYLDLDDYDMAISDFTRAVTLYPNYDFAWDHRGDAYYYLDEPEKAIVDYNKAIELNSRNKYYWKDRGNAFMEINEYPKAISDFENSVNLDNQYDYAIKRIGDCYYAMERYETAIEFYDRALEIDPEYRHALFKKGLSYGALNLSNKAIDTYQQIVLIDPEYSVAYGNIGWEYYVLGNYEKCIEYSKKAIELYNRAAYAMFNLALATLRLDKTEESKQLYKSYIDHCIQHDISIPAGAKSDLQDLIDQNIKAEEATEIITFLDNEG